MKRMVAAAILSLACASSVAAPTKDHTPIVEARQSSMKAMAAAARTIAGMFNGKVTYDAAAFKAAAETIRSHTGALMAAFPSDSLGAPSGAKLEIDQARPEFEALARHIATLSDVLADDAARAPNDITADMRMGPRMVMGGGSLLGKRPGTLEIAPAKLPAEHVLHLILQDCANCHSKFRQQVQ